MRKSKKKKDKRGSFSHFSRIPVKAMKDAVFTGRESAIIPGFGLIDLNQLYLSKDDAEKLINEFRKSRLN